MHEVVSGVLEQEGDPPGASHLPARRRHQTGGVAQQGRLPRRRFAPHQRHPLPGRHHQGGVAQDRRTIPQLVPHVLEGQRGRRGGLARGSAAPQPPRAAPPRRRQPRPLCIVARGRQQIGPPQRGTRALDARHRGQAQRSQQLGPRRLEVGSLPAGPLQEAVGRGIADDPPAGEGDDTIGRPQAPLEAMLSQDDRRVGVLVDAPQEADELITGDRIKLRGRLVQDDNRGRPARAAPSATRCSSPPDSSAVERSRRWSMASASAASSTPRAIGRRAPAVLERERQLGADRRGHDLGLGVLEQRPDHGGELAGTVLAGVHPRDRHPPRERAAVEVRHQAADRSQQRRLARSRRARHHHQLARRHLE